MYVSNNATAALLSVGSAAVQAFQASECCNSKDTEADLTSTMAAQVAFANTRGQHTTCCSDQTACLVCCTANAGPFLSSV